MKTALRRAALVLGALLLAAASFVAYCAIDGVPRYPRPAIADLHVEATPARLARGRQLFTLTCAGCHLDPHSGRATGHPITDIPPAFGVIHSANITRDPVHGIGSMSDGELEHVLRTGVRADGRFVPPWMIKTPHLSDEDLHSLVAFLRSDDPQLAATAVAAPPSRPSLLAKVLAHTIIRPLPPPAGPVVAPPRQDRVAYGRYLTLALDCYSCHSPDFTKVDPLHPERTPGYLSGGNPMVDAEGRTIFTANLTPDARTGIGRWSEADFVRAVRRGFRPDGRVLHWPMEARPALDEQEAAAIYAYLRTVPAIEHEVVRPASPATTAPPVADAAAEGRRVYERYGCPSCHGNEGVGLGGAADLRHANEHFTSDAALRAWIDDAPEQKPGTRMPGWRGVIREEDYAPLLRHVRALARQPYALR